MVGSLVVIRFRGSLCYPLLVRLHLPLKIICCTLVPAESAPTGERGLGNPPSPPPFVCHRYLQPQLSMMGDPTDIEVSFNCLRLSSRSPPPALSSTFLLISSDSVDIRVTAIKLSVNSNVFSDMFEVASSSPGEPIYVSEKASELTPFLEILEGKRNGEYDLEALSTLARLADKYDSFLVNLLVRSHLW